MSLASTADQITIGIDISKHQLDVHLHPGGIVEQFDNDRKGHAKLIGWLSPRQPTRIIFEATGAYHRALEMALGKAGLSEPDSKSPCRLVVAGDPADEQESHR